MYYVFQIARRGKINSPPLGPLICALQKVITNKILCNDIERGAGISERERERERERSQPSILSVEIPEQSSNLVLLQKRHLK